jgi:hypothetical protein
MDPRNIIQSDRRTRGRRIDYLKLNQALYANQSDPDEDTDDDSHTSGDSYKVTAESDDDDNVSFSSDMD